jgi:uncharacterized protein YdeI (YjbR/CyaY-like superfamily)
MNGSAPSRLRRRLQTMPADMESALVEFGLMDAYQARPPYQQNDYIGWIARAKRRETQEKRIGQMLDELAYGDLYMNMAWHGRPSASSGYRGTGETARG